MHGNGQVLQSKNTAGLLLRGVLNFVDSLVLGMRTLMYSASFFEEEEEKELSEE